MCAGCNGPHCNLSLGVEAGGLCCRPAGAVQEDSTGFIRSSACLVIILEGKKTGLTCLWKKINVLVDHFLLFHIGIYTFCVLIFFLFFP